mmetsp:Transcript_20571/g.36544  ORF Transcript_20571/g.36544 Transcript_20571/m.36544 type:complete len:84 (-) Transcript_20571:383-634(-)
MNFLNLNIQSSKATNSINRRHPIMHRMFHLTDLLMKRNEIPIADAAMICSSSSNSNRRIHLISPRHRFLLGIMRRNLLLQFKI